MLTCAWLVEHRHMQCDGDVSSTKIMTGDVSVKLAANESIVASPWTNAAGEFHVELGKVRSNAAPCATVASAMTHGTASCEII